MCHDCRNSVGECSWCGGAAARPGVLLEVIANGRTVCVPCGRFQIDCECRPNVAPRRPNRLSRYGGKADRPANAQPDAWIAERVLAGWRPAAIATAASVSLRSAQRWCAEISGVETVRAGDQVARFAIRRTLPPVRLEPWRAER